MVNKNKQKEEEEDEKARIANEKGDNLFASKDLSAAKKHNDYDYLVRSLQFDSQKAQVNMT